MHIRYTRPSSCSGIIIGGNGQAMGAFTLEMAAESVPAALHFFTYEGEQLNINMRPLLYEATLAKSPIEPLLEAGTVSPEEAGMLYFGAETALKYLRSQPHLKISQSIAKTSLGRLNLLEKRRKELLPDENPIVVMSATREAEVFGDSGVRIGMFVAKVEAEQSRIEIRKNHHRFSISFDSRDKFNIGDIRIRLARVLGKKVGAERINEKDIAVFLAGCSEVQGWYAQSEEMGMDIAPLFHEAATELIGPDTEALVVFLTQTVRRPRSGPRRDDETAGPVYTTENTLIRLRSEGISRQNARAYHAAKVELGVLYDLYGHAQYAGRTGLEVAEEFNERLTGLKRQFVQAQERRGASR